jgi:hypothetical protein
MFIFDRDGKRVFDQDTGFELKKVQMFTDGTWDFVLRLDDKEVRFSATFEQKVVPGSPTTIYWKIGHLFLPAGVEIGFVKEIITEAMNAYKQINGKPQNSNVIVSYYGDGVK